MNTDATKLLPRLLTDQRGSMLVVGIPMGLFLTAVTWHLIGICDAALLAEFLRFTADRTAFESAIWHSRGMNVVAMLNVLMTALSAVWAAWNILENSIGFAGSLCQAPPPAYCNGHDETEAQNTVHQMINGDAAVKKWLSDQAIAISDLQKATSSVTPTIALDQTAQAGSGSAADWLEFALAVSTAQVPDDNIDAVTGYSVQSSYPRLGVATRLPSLPLEAAPSPNYCSNISKLVPDVADSMSTRLKSRWHLDTLAATNYDWRSQFELAANSMSCLGFASNVDAAGVWFLAQWSSQQYHQYAFAVWGLAFGKNGRASSIDTGVQLGGSGAAGAFTPVDSYTVSQAEFYYDCGGQAWSKCQDSALMSPGWTARLHRARQPSSTVNNLFNSLAIPASFKSSLPASVQGVLTSNTAIWTRLQDLIH